MPLRAGARVGPYEVLASIGAGGMGEVYRARDTRLHRDVAIKVIRDQFVGDADRIARFQREARLLAALNHPHIAAIYGLEETDGVRALVLELVDGQTLADRLRGGPVPVREALEIARQIAGALDAAHEQGIVHRDLKPSNIKVTADGRVKVLDFGIAKAIAGDPPKGDPGDVTTAAATGDGNVLGTPAYLSPEQARGRAVDKRADIWAFGCVLYEMLTGRAAFRGDTVPDTLVRVLERDPDWEGLPEATPAAARALLRRCLEKDPKQRLRDIGDAGFELSEGSGSPQGAAARSGRWWPPAAAALAAIGLGSLGWYAAGRTATSVPAPAQFTVELPAAAPFVDRGSGNRFIALRRAADGRDASARRSAGGLVGSRRRHLLHALPRRRSVACPGVGRRS